MSVYYIVPRGEKLDMAKHAEFHSYDSAQQHADASHQRNGKHYHVIKVETVWVTTTMADIMAEKKELEAAQQSLQKVFEDCQKWGSD